MAAISIKLINQVLDSYLQAQGGVRLHPEPLAEAWAWGRRPRRATTAILQATDDDHVDVFDYLVDIVQRRRPPGDQVPGHVVRATADAGDSADLDSIAATAYTQGRYELAEHAYQRAYQIKVADADLGPEHPNTLISRDRLALALIALGRPEEAEAEQRAVISIATGTLCPEHPTTLASRANLARALRALGRLEEAETERRTI